MLDNPPARETWVRQAVDRYERPLMLYALRFVRNLDTARDIVQDTFLKLCDQDPGDLDGRLAPWLYTVCRNRALDVAKKQKPMRNSADPGATLAAHESSDPAAAAEQSDLQTHLLAAIEELPANQQEVILLKFQHSLSYKEIAKATDMTPGYVGYLIHIGLKTLCARMADVTA